MEEDWTKTTRYGKEKIQHLCERRKYETRTARILLRRAYRVRHWHVRESNEDAQPERQQQVGCRFLWRFVRNDDRRYRLHLPELHAGARRQPVRVAPVRMSRMGRHAGLFPRHVDCRSLVSARLHRVSALLRSTNLHEDKAVAVFISKHLPRLSSRVLIGTRGKAGRFISSSDGFVRDQAKIPIHHGRVLTRFFSSDHVVQPKQPESQLSATRRGSPKKEAPNRTSSQSLGTKAKASAPLDWKSPSTRTARLRQRAATHNVARDDRHEMHILDESAVELSRLSQNAIRKQYPLRRSREPSPSAEGLMDLRQDPHP